MQRQVLAAEVTGDKATVALFAVVLFLLISQELLAAGRLGAGDLLIVARLAVVRLTKKKNEIGVTMQKSPRVLGPNLFLRLISRLCLSISVSKISILSLFAFPFLHPA